MYSSDNEPPRRFSPRVHKCFLCFTYLIGVPMPLIASAHDTEIVIAREVVISQGHAGDPHVIAKTSDLGFVIAGSMGTAWATRVSSSGTVLWEYSDRVRASLTSRSNFQGVLPMKDDTTLLCGSKPEGPEKGANQLGFIVRIDSTGKVISEESYYPNADKQYAVAEFSKCLSWGDGIALVGRAVSRSGAFGWLIKLDAQGNRQWEKVQPELGGFDAFETSSNDLILVMPGQYDLFTKTIVRVSPSGEVIARRTVRASEIGRVHAVSPNDHIYVATHDLTGTKLLTLDSKLQDTRPPQILDSIDFDHGCSYLFPDGSLALFGYTDSTGHPSAAIARVSAIGKQTALHLFKRSEESPWIADAAFMSATEYVTVRQSVDPAEKHRGIVLDWVAVR
jgi:hypothetical protein